jgi:dihydrofolate synthase/folylpolyglutamate synthase
VELAVLEVGLGGRLDATTTHPNRQVLALASIGMDHTEHLGSTLAAIAGEKAGVMHTGAIAVSGPQAAEAEAVLRQVAQARQCTLRWVEPLAAASAGGPLLGLRGELQRHNAAVAVGAAQALAEQGWAIDEAAILQGLAQARWPGRLEHRHFQGQPLMVDGAHNPPAAEALRRELDDPGPRRWLIGSQRHKDAPDLLRRLLRAGDAVRVVLLPDHPSWSASALREALQALGPEAVEIAAGSGDLAADLSWLVQSQALPVVAGSLYLVAEVLPLLDPAPD